MLKNGFKYLLNHYVLLLFLICVNGLVVSSLKVTLSDQWGLVGLIWVVVILGAAAFYCFYSGEEDGFESVKKLLDSKLDFDVSSDDLSLNFGFKLVIFIFFFMTVSHATNFIYFSELKVNKIDTVISEYNELNNRLDIMLERENISVLTKSVDVNISNIKHIMDSDVVFVTKDPKEALAMYQHVKLIDANMQIIGDVIKHKYDLLIKINQTGLDKSIVDYTESFINNFDDILIDKDVAQMNIDYYVFYKVLYFIEVILMFLYVLVFFIGYKRQGVKENSIV